MGHLHKFSFMKHLLIFLSLYFICDTINNIVMVWSTIIYIYQKVQGHKVQDHHLRCSVPRGHRYAYTESSPKYPGGFGKSRLKSSANSYWVQTILPTECLVWVEGGPVLVLPAAVCVPYWLW